MHSFAMFRTVISRQTDRLIALETNKQPDYLMSTKMSTEESMETSNKKLLV